MASTARLLEWLRSFAPKSRLIVVSSAAVYGADHAGPISESAALVPMSPYGHHKLMMEQLCRSYVQSFGLCCMVVRLFSVYGPHLRKQLLWDICSRLRNEQRTLNLGGTGAEIRDWTDVRDVVRLLARVAEEAWQDDFGVINGGSGRGVSVAGIADGLIGHWGSNTSVQFSGVARPGDPASLLADNGRVLDMNFDWHIPLERGLADYVEWFRGQTRA
nr:SDR family oxidoreductase [Bradyrhizobium japonicum]